MALLDKVQDNIRKLVPYPPGKPVEEVERELGISGSVKLASNESAIGPSPMAVDAAKSSLSGIHRYPDGSGYYLKKSLSEKYKVRPENIILGNGSNEIIELAARAFLGPQDEAVFGDPAFIVYKLVTQAAGGLGVAVPLKDFTHDLEAMRSAITNKTRIVFIANPNNPTGSVVDKSVLETFCMTAPDDVLVVVDEAYHEFASRDNNYQTSLSLMKERQNILILRTFSKAYGLAGLRVGFGIASSELISMLDRVRQPFNVNLPALAAAKAALKDEGFLKEAIKVNNDGIGYLSDEFGKMGLDYVKTAANFILFNCGREGDEVYRSLLGKGVIVRPMKGYGLDRHLRVTVGRHDENVKFITSLKECLSREPVEIG